MTEKTSLELDVLDLDPNEVYFIRINDFSTTGTPNWGTFLLCIDEIDPINTIDQGGSNACTGELYDTGGPDGDYGSSENNVFSICPPLGQNACITFNLQYFNIESFSDQLIIYDGPDTNSPVISDLDGGGNGPNNGGVCNTFQATSGCLTVQFISDGGVEFEGFAGFWECSAVPCDPIDIVDIDNSVTEQEIIDNVSTPQTLVTVDTIICANGAYGTFMAGDNSELGLEQGLVLTSGSVLNAVGPNTQTGATQINNTPGDADLDYLSTITGGGSQSNDACIVELDVFVATDELVFEYVFGSEEYPEWVNSSFNDIFAFLISGPGITGDPMMNDQENIAVVPMTTTPVQINSVNDAQNWEYYRNNNGGTSVEYDGLTSDFLGVKKSLTARSTVIPCNTYHLKLAVADRGDASLDSGVFISEIKGGTPSLSINFASGVDYLVEDCTGMDDVLLITLSNPLPDSVTYDVSVTGTAQQGVDYILNIPSQVTIPAGTTQLEFPIIPLSDAIVEGTETIIITLSNNFGCGDIELNQLVVELADAPVVDIFSGQDTAFVCLNECIIMEVEGAVDYFWEPVSVVDDPTATNPEACPQTSQFLYVTGSISALPGCSDTDTIWLEVVDPQLDIVPLGDVNLCNGESVQLQAVNNVGNTNLEWSPGTGLDNTDQEIVTASPGVGTVTYTAEVEVSGCTASDEITVTVDAFDFPNLTTADTTICQGQSVTLASNIPITTTTYEWTPDEFLEPSNTVSGPIATPETTTTYTLIGTSASGACADTASINIEVIPAEVTVMPEDTAYICRGEIASLTANTTTNMVVWTPSEGVSDTSSLTIDVDIEESMWYYATMTIGACTVTDSVYVRVDSIPELPISVIPDDQPYCPGEILTLVSPTYEPNDYPDIMHQWDPGLGAESDLDNLNLVITTVETVTFVRTTTNNACVQLDSIEIDVVDVGDLQIAWTDTTICQGDPLMNEVFNGTGPEWSPGTGLSCTECPNPTITANDTITYSVEVNVMGCPLTETVQVNVQPDASAALIDDATICIGDAITLNSPSGNSPGTTYTWTANPPDATLDPNEPFPTVTPNQTTTYTLVVDNGICDPFEGEVTVIVQIDPIVTVDPDAVLCSGDEITLTASSTEEGGVFTWTGPTLENPIEGNSITVSPNDTTNYTVTYSYPCGDDIVNTINVDVIEGIDVDIIINPDTSSYPEGSIVDVSATLVDPVNNPTFVWNTGNTTQTFTDTITETPTATYSVTVTTAEGCTDSDELTVDVTEALYDIPNAFSPDGDELNDFFNVVALGNFEVRVFKVYSRWGQLVYDNESPMGWDGRFKDKDLPPDVYIYVIELVRPSGEVIVEKGDVVLIR